MLEFKKYGILRTVSISEEYSSHIAFVSYNSELSFFTALGFKSGYMSPDFVTSDDKDFLLKQCEKHALFNDSVVPVRNYLFSIKLIGYSKPIVYIENVEVEEWSHAWCWLMSLRDSTVNLDTNNDTLGETRNFMYIETIIKLKE